MKVVVDEDTGKTFARALRDLLEPEGVTVARSVEVGWRGKKNGELLALARAPGYTHLVSSDKMMAEEHQPLIPVLLVDQMANADIERIRRTALAVAGLLFDNAPTKAGYYAVFVEGYEPEKRLRRVAEGEHKMSRAEKVPAPKRRSRAAWLFCGMAVAVSVFLYFAIVEGKAGHRAGDRFRNCPECPEMVVVPAGSYQMGSPSYEQGRREYEGPVHEVTIAAPFAIGVYEVTVAEFGQFVDETGYSVASSCLTYEGAGFHADRSWRNPSFGQGRRHPVTCVSWNDAQAYAAWLSQETGEEYRLPSESEWEYVARAGTSTPQPWVEGEAGQCRHANGADASDYSALTVESCRDGHAHTAPVGSFAASGWGLHDMLGNVWEWTEDCWNDSYGGAPLDGSAWEHGYCGRRVLRGGSWYDSPSDLRAADRVWDSAGNRYFDYGFRVARTLVP